MKLLASTASPYTRKVRIVLAEKKIDCEIEQVDVAPVDNPVNPHNPLGKIPTLVLDDGTALYDSRVIVEFLDGKSPISRLIPDESLREPKERSQAWTDKQLARLKRGMAQMASELAERAWCQGERYSLADIAVGCCLGWVNFRKPGDVDWLGEYPGLSRHYDKLMLRPTFADTVPQVPK
jgi:glutathione S-transferase